MIDAVELSSGVVLRSWVDRDAAALMAAVDAEQTRLGRWMPWVPFSTAEADFAAFIERSREAARDGTAVHLGLFDHDRVVGAVGASIGVLNFDEADVGYWVASSHEGHGIAAEAARHLVVWLFEERDMHRITIRAAVGNVRSVQLAERLGFTREAVLRESLLLDGVHVDAIQFSLLAGEWDGAG